ncbi:hypothetical protein [Rhizobium sp. WYCCWR10014]|uniref:hypothetical protein n=1 Tax=Rhizobium sp. WYCCWR10014 TaxID=1825933 RepID=UPI0012E7F7EE|nr:hypothetical protein [Rhizobium sp. WYCCWR10014]
MRLAQAISASASTPSWISLIPPFAGGSTAPQPFHLNFLITPVAIAPGELLVLTLRADPASAAAGQEANLILTMTGAGAQWSSIAGPFGNLVSPDAAGALRITGMIELTDNHDPLKLTLNGVTPDVSVLGSGPPLLELTARQPLSVRFGPPGLSDLLGRSAAIEAAGREPFFTSTFAERLSKLDPQGWLILGPPTLAGKLASGAGLSPSPNTSLRKRMLVSVGEAYRSFLDARMNPAECWPLLPFPSLPGDDVRITHLKTVLVDRFNSTYGDEYARESTAIVPLDSDEAVNLPLPDAHPIVVPYDLGDAIPLNDLIGETTGVAVLVEADGRAFAPDTASEVKYANTFTLNAARLEYAGGDIDQELCIGSRPSVPDGADIRSFSYNARPLVAPLSSEIDQLDQREEHLYRIMPFSSAKAEEDWGRRVPQMRFGWKYRFRSFLVSQGGALPPDLWYNGDPATLRRPAVDEKDGFGEAFRYLCRTPVSAPRWGKSPAGRRPEDCLPLAAELPDLPPPIDILEAQTATHYLSDQDGSGLLPFSSATPLEIRVYGLRIADDGEAVVSLRRGRLGASGSYINIRICPDSSPALETKDGDFLVRLPRERRDTYDDADAGEWHLRLLVRLTQSAAVLSADLMMEAGTSEKLAVLEPDLVHAFEPIGTVASISINTDPGDIYLAMTAQKGPVRTVPPRVWAGPYRQVCPETAGQQPEIIALDSRSGEASLDIRPPAATFSTWVRHLLSDKPLVDTTLNRRIDAAFKASQQKRSDGTTAAVDHPRVVSLFVEVVPLFPRARTGATLHEIRLPDYGEDDPAGDQKPGFRLRIVHAKSVTFDIDRPVADLGVSGRDVIVTLASGHVAEVRAYAAIRAEDFDGPKARFASSLARGRRRVDGFILGPPLRLRVEASANAALVDRVIPAGEWRNRLTARPGDTFQDWGHPIVDGSGQLQRVEARPMLAPPGDRRVARILRLFASVTVYDQQWSWRGRIGASAPRLQDTATLEAFGKWSTRLFYGRSDKDAEYGEPIPLLPQRIRRADRLDQAPAMPLTQRDLGYHGSPMLWRFSAEFHGRYPGELGFDRHTLSGFASDTEEKRQGRWAHVIVQGALAAEGTGPGRPPEQRRPAFEIWLPLAEQLREASAAAPVLLMFSEPWYSRGNFADALQVVSILTRHPLPTMFEDNQGPSWTQDQLSILFGDDIAFKSAKQYPKFWQSWGPDPILTGAASQFHAVTLAVSGPLGWTQSEGAITDFRRTSFILEPTANEKTGDLLALRPMFQLAHRRILDPELVDLPAELLRGYALWQSAIPKGTANAPRRLLQWRFYPPAERPTAPFAGQLAGFQGVRVNWKPPALQDGVPVFMRLEDAAPSGENPRRMVVELRRIGDTIDVRLAISEPLLDQNPWGWRINHLPPMSLAAQQDGEVEIQLDVSPTAPAQTLDVGAAPDTYDVVVSARASMTSLWEGGMLARFKAPAGNGSLRFDFPGTTQDLASRASLKPFAASPFSESFWTQFFSDTSRFRCQAVGSTSPFRSKIEAMGIKLFTGGAGFTAAVGSSHSAVQIWPLVPDKSGSERSEPRHRLVAVVTKWITDAEGRRSEMPVFASPVRATDQTGSYFSFPTDGWPKAGRLRLLTVFATVEAPAFGPETEPTSQNRFAVMEEILRARNAAASLAEKDIAPFDLDTEDSELAEATMIIVGVSKPLEF